jgi:hypothetical protein
VVAEQDLGDRQADELAVGQLGWVTRSPAGFQQVVDGDLQCDDEVVETGVHGASLEVDVALATPTLGGLVSLVTPCHPQPNTTSVIQGAGQVAGSGGLMGLGWLAGDDVEVVDDRDPA